MVDPQLGLGIVYNGAIYNYPELRAELQAAGYRFFSTGDTEVVLKAFHAWGRDCVKRFNGMFAFAIVDRDSGVTTLARDRLGIKPLYYVDRPDSFRFASSLPALVAGGDISLDLDPVALHHYLTFHAVVPPPRTMLREVAKLCDAVLACLRSRRDAVRLRRLLPIARWSILAFGLLSKLILNARCAHYGFVLAMPGTLLCVGCAVAWIPDRLHRGYGGGAWFRSAMVAATLALVVFQLRESDRHYAVKDFAFGRGADAMWVENPRVQTRGRDLSAALERLEAILPADATLLVLPDGVGLNFWLKRRNPSRYTLFLPTEIRDLGGEEAILADLRREPADFVVLIDRKHEEFGVGPFGRDPRNGRRIVAWVEANYRRIERFGAEPFQGRGFGVVLLRYRGDASASPEGARR